MKRPIVLALTSVFVGACSILPSMSSLNPFSSSVPAKDKPAELVAFTPSATLRVQWQASVGNADESVFSPAVVGDSVFTAAANGTLARFDDGREAWRVRTDKPLSGGVGSDGKRVVAGTLKGELYAFDGSGKALWQARVPSAILAAPAVVSDVVVVRSGDNRITAFAADTGKKLWVFQRSTPALSLRSFAGVVVSGKNVYAGFPGGKLVALSLANGAQVWEGTVAQPKGSTELERITDVTSDPVVSGRLACAAAFQGRVACFDSSTGEALWSRELSSSHGLDMDRQYLYATDDKGNVFAMDKDSGASIWKYDRLANRGVGRPVVLPGYVAVADAKGVVHLLRREDGALAARIETDGSAVLADPKAFGRSAFVVQTRKGSLLSLAP